MTTLARKLIFTSVHTDSVIRIQLFPNFTFHRILPNVIHRITVNLPMNSIPVSVTLIDPADIYLLLDKINLILTLMNMHTTEQICADNKEEPQLGYGSLKEYVANVI